VAVRTVVCAQYTQSCAIVYGSACGSVQCAVARCSV
jgi:hypothetical protein